PVVGEARVGDLQRHARRGTARTVDKREVHAAVAAGSKTRGGHERAVFAPAFARLERVAWRLALGLEIAGAPVEQPIAQAGGRGRDRKRGAVLQHPCAGLAGEVPGDGSEREQALPSSPTHSSIANTEAEAFMTYPCGPGGCDSSGCGCPSPARPRPSWRRNMRDGRTPGVAPWSFFLPVALAVLVGVVVAGLILRGI